MAGGSPQSTSAPNGPSARRPWRGAAPKETPQHQWQQEGKSAAAAHTAWRRRRKLIIASLFAGSGLLLALLVWNLLYAPVQTPLIAIAATGYDWPLPPNAWATEDVAALAALDRRTVRLTDLSSEWRTADRGLARLDEELKRIASRNGRSRVVILYLSMYGALDGAGQPCLIPPGASPQDSSTWLKLADVLQRIKTAGVPNSLHKLLVLDGSRELVNWNLGQLGGGFAEALPAALEEAQIPNLAILNSARGGEAAIASSALALRCLATTCGWAWRVLPTAAILAAAATATDACLCRSCKSTSRGIRAPGPTTTRDSRKRRRSSRPRPISTLRGRCDQAPGAIWWRVRYASNGPNRRSRRRRSSRSGGSWTICGPPGPGASIRSAGATSNIGCCGWSSLPPPAGRTTSGPVRSPRSSPPRWTRQPAGTPRPAAAARGQRMRQSWLATRMRRRRKCTPCRWPLFGARQMSIRSARSTCSSKM